MHVASDQLFILNRSGEIGKKSKGSFQWSDEFYLLCLRHRFLQPRQVLQVLRKNRRRLLTFSCVALLTVWGIGASWRRPGTTFSGRTTWQTSDIGQIRREVRWRSALVLFSTSLFLFLKDIRVVDREEIDCERWSRRRIWDRKNGTVSGEASAAFLCPNNCQQNSLGERLNHTIVAEQAVCSLVKMGHCCLEASKNVNYDITRNKNKTHAD